METKTTSFQFPELPEILRAFQENIFGFLNKPMILAIPQDALAVSPWQVIHIYQRAACVSINSVGKSRNGQSYFHDIVSGKAGEFHLLTNVNGFCSS